MTERGASIPGMQRLGQDAQQVAALFPRRLPVVTEAWKAFPVEIPAGLNKLAEGHCGYGN
jgi:hypothetical protein